MYVDYEFQSKLIATCKRPGLVKELQRFLQIWTDARLTQVGARRLLKDFCNILDQAGKWHESETIFQIGAGIINHEEERRAQDRTMLGIVGSIVAGTVIVSLFKRRNAA